MDRPKSANYPNWGVIPQNERRHRGTHRVRLNQANAEKRHTRGYREMNEQEARELLDGMTREDMISLYEMLLALRHKK